MAVSTTNSYSPTIDELVKDAMVLAGTMNSRQTVGDHNVKDDAAMVRRFLSGIVDELAANGVILRHVEFRTLTLTQGTYDYALTADVVDVLGVMMYAGSTAGSGEALVRQIRHDDWNRLSAKDASGIPSFVLVMRDDEIPVARFWPIPDDTGATVRYKAHVRPQDSNNGAFHLDFPPFWRNYLVHRMASMHCIAQSLEQKGLMLMQIADRQLAENMNKSKTKASVQASVSHRSGWNRPYGRGMR